MMDQFCITYYAVSCVQHTHGFLKIKTHKHKQTQFQSQHLACRTNLDVYRVPANVYRISWHFKMTGEYFLKYSLFEAKLLQDVVAVPETAVALAIDV